MGLGANGADGSLLDEIPWLRPGGHVLDIHAYRGGVIVAVQEPLVECRWDDGSTEAVPWHRLIRRRRYRGQWATEI
jgi:hypothetical protein